MTCAAARKVKHQDTLRSLTLAAIVAGALLSGSSASAQTFVEYQQLFGGASALPTIDSQLEIPGKTVNVYGWFLVNDAWGEALLGISKSIRPWLWGAVSVGIETDEPPWRGSGAVSGAKGRFSTFFVAEYGGTGYWYRFTGTARLAPRTEVGLHSQRAYGTGPFVRISLGQGFSVWASVVEGPQSLAGILKSF